MDLLRWSVVPTGVRRIRVFHRCWALIAIALLGAVPASAQLRVVPYVSGLSFPVEFVQDPSTRSLQYVVEQTGRIRVIQAGVLLPTPFLDVSAVISAGGERGLLGLAFPQDYATSGRFFINFTDPVGHTVVARFKRSTLNPLVADTTTRFDLRWGGRQPYITQPFANHNGGHMAFGPDGYLYVGLGDGGSGDDPFNNSQNPATLLGKLVRIDVSVADSHPNGYVVPTDNPFVDNLPIAALPEIWAFGLRNPWKFTFDDPERGGTGAMMIADVGQNQFEEIDFQPPGAGGRNYGWRTREGAHAYITSPPPAYLPVIDPVAEYDHSVGHSITGGYVYRGRDLGAAYRARYFFADFVAGRVWSIALSPAAGGEATASGLVEHTAELGGTAVVGNVSAFGADASGEIYIVSYSGGRILKLVDSQHRRPTPFDFDGDGRTDVAVWRPSNGIWGVSRSSNGGVLSAQWGATGDRPVPGDYDGDGRTDIAVWRPSSGVWGVIKSSNGGVLSPVWGAAGDQPVPGDYDGDGKTDFAVWHPATGVWDVMRSTNGVTMSRQWGAGFAPYNDVPVPADYDGDGVTDIAVWRASSGTWFIIRSSDGVIVSRQWGAGYAPYNDVPVPGDYDGDGKADLAVYRPSTGTWGILLSSGNYGTYAAVVWGVSTDIPVPGDYDGDGKTDIAVWRPSSGIWGANRSSDGGVSSVQWGVSTDNPIPRSP